MPAVEQSEAEQKKTAEQAREYEDAVAGGAARPGRPPKGADPVQVARARWERLRAQAAARYEEDQQLRAQGRRGRGRAVLPPDENAKVRAAWVAYQDALADAAQHADPAAGSTSEEQDRGEQVPDDAAEKTGSSSQPGLCANLTDPDSRLLKTRNGWIQGMNCQTSTSDDVFIITARATQDANDVNQFVPTKDQTEATMAQVARGTGRKDLTRVGTMIADAGYDSQDNLTADGPDRLIADSKGRHIEARAAADPASGRPPEEASTRERMNHRLRTPEGLALYRRRSHMIEAPNAWLKDGRGLRQFSRRGLSAVQSELSLAAGVTNLMRIAARGVTTDQLRTS